MMSPALGYSAFAAATLFYAVATVSYYWQIARGGRNDASENQRIPPILLGIGAAAHALYVLVTSFVLHICPVHSVHFILSMATLLAIAGYLVARNRLRIYALGVALAPLGLVVTLGTFFLGSGPSQKLPASFTVLHVFANLVGVSLFLLAFGAAVMYLVKERRLKQKRSLLGGGLGPLDSLDRAGHRFLLAGFPLLTLGAATGTMYAHGIEPGSLAELLRAIFGYATWLSIAAVLLLRLVAGWRGRRAAYGTVAGFMCALVVLFIYLVRPALSASGTLGG